ncbi:hypothetical protein, partial [Vibrio campbellii]|uniref:hypothetical protein n=1 Tax=Vibrio campbellii TaxID=680 RepID=UPI001C4E0D96
ASLSFSRFSLLASRFSLLASRFSLLASRFSLPYTTLIMSIICLDLRLSNLSPANCVAET